MVADQIPQNPLAHPMIEEEEDEISNEELACSYSILYESWINTINIDADLQG